jgi:cell division FtsZ-interacting protein ZapD
MIVNMEDFRTYDELNMAQLGDLRAWQLERLERVSQALRARVRAEHTDGDNIKALAKKLGVTRATIYAWLSE